MRAIDADHLKETLDNLVCESDNKVIEKNTNRVLHALMPQVIADEPTIEAEPVKYGRWVRKHNSFPQRYFCTECGGGDVGRFAFCHHCGARMRMDGGSE